jgi:hypothetical protein
MYRHHLELALILVQAVSGKISPRIIISMPPRSGKSELCSHWFPVWFLNLFPHLNVLLASYESDYAARWGRKVRNTIQTNQSSLRVRISDDSRAADRWETSLGGGMSTAGTKAALTGKGGHCLIIDDPHKDRREAESPAIREQIWDWWTGTARPRLEPTPLTPNGVVIVIMTRWHEEDLAGRLKARKVDLDEESGHALPWIDFRLPAIAEENDILGRKPGEALWPEKYDLNSLQITRAEMSPYDWASEYQQSPVPKSGNLFRREYFQPIEVI